jgi:hypothetical protein
VTRPPASRAITGASSREIWGEGGPVWLDDPVDGIPTAGGTGLPGTTGEAGARAELYGFDNFFRGKVPTPTGSEPRLFYGRNIVENYAAFRPVREAWSAASGARPCERLPAELGASGPALRRVAGTPFLPQEINPINETTKSAYGMLRFKHDFDGDIRMTGNVGLRYTKTEREAEGFLAFPLATFTSDADCADAAANWARRPRSSAG